MVWEVSDMDEFFGRIKFQASKAKDEAKKITKQVVNKTNSLLGQTKVSFAISEAESKIDDIYKEIGKDIFGRYNKGEDFGTRINESCEKINALMEEIASLQETLAELKVNVRCSCGELNPKTSTYCSKCGQKLNEAEFEVDEEDVVIINPISSNEE